MQGFSAFSFWASPVYRIKSGLWSAPANPHKGMVAQAFNLGEKGKSEKKKVAQVFNLCRDWLKTGATKFKKRRRGDTRGRPNLWT